MKTKERLIKELHDFQRAININGMSTFYSDNGLVFISDFLKDIENFLQKEINLKDKNIITRSTKESKKE
jgi:hypothetical protein